MKSVDINMMVECLAHAIDGSPIEMDYFGIPCFGPCLVNRRHARLITQHNGEVYTDLCLKESPETAVFEFLSCKAEEYLERHGKPIDAFKLAISYTVHQSVVEPVGAAVDAEIEYLKRSLACLKEL